MRTEIDIAVEGGAFQKGIMDIGDLTPFSGHGRPKNWIAADILRIVDGVLVERWDVIQDEASRAESKSGLPMFGGSFGG
jgi:predicted SnoaL-like aldol condensation-catalyzing enzyme